ncbi:uncharacterized protein LOC128182279 [Crassostrea angulata]|uniref:uncharacterized protein LOC128182279 n=1 Tax=Magallana angulata TaxID=2784310 RepID=UPI0022B14666|nr:uncharacterized protein LOC128182279 [Crassostrea angulata]
MDSFDKVNDGVNSNKCATDDNVRMRSLTNKPTKDSHVFDDVFILSKKSRKMKELHQELLGMVEARERREDDSRMLVPRRVFLFNVDIFKDTQQIEDFENTDTAPPDPGNRFSTLETDGSQQGPVKATDAKYSCEVKPSKRNGVFSRLKKYFGF